MMFASRVVNTDPNPYAERAGVTVFAPRPEYTLFPSNPINPILVEFRRSCPWDVPLAAAREAEWLRQPGARPVPENATEEQIEHARKVLTRLASASRIG
jgi:hypothetical protein